MRITVKQDRYYGESYIDNETQGVYRRLLAGLGWPVGVKNGFAVIVAEDYERDYTTPGMPWHLHVLAEVESGSIEELSRLLKSAHRDFPFSDLLFDTDNPLRRLWLSQITKDELIGRLPAGYDKMGMEVARGLIMNLSELKILHIPEKLSRLRGYLHDISQEDLQVDVKDFPALFALGCALSEITFIKLPDLDEIEEEESRNRISQLGHGRSPVTGY